jgi:hypothetical protein
VTKSRELEDALLDEYVASLSTLGDAQIRALVHTKVSAASERKAFESASQGVSRETLILLASGYLARLNVEMPAPASHPFPTWFRESLT